MKGSVLVGSISFSVIIPIFEEIFFSIDATETSSIFWLKLVDIGSSSSLLPTSTFSIFICLWYTKIESDIFPSWKYLDRFSIEIRESSARVSRVIKSVIKGISIFVDHLRKFPSSGISGLQEAKKITEMYTNILFCKRYLWF